MCAAPMGMMAAGSQRAGGDALAAWGGPGRPQGRGAGPGVPAVCVLREGLDRGLAGPGDVAGPAVGPGGDAHGGAQGDRGGVLRHRAAPGTGVAAAPAGRRLRGRARGPEPGVGRARDRGVRAGVLREPVRVDGAAFEHYGIQLWTPEVGGRVDLHAEDHAETMLALGPSSKREIARTRIGVRTAMAAQTREQGRYLGGRPPYGYRLGDAGPHPNKAHAAWGRRAHRTGAAWTLRTGPRRS
jgi:hypothetical protein